MSPVTAPEVSSIRYNNERQAASRRQICLFAQYSNDGRLRDDTVAYLEALAAAGFTVRVAFSNVRSICAADAETLRKIGGTWLVRDNAGLDFGAWRDLILSGAADGADEVLLANDSVIGPFRPLGPIFRAMSGFDVWGMVRSREGQPHLQSWFVCMSGEAFRLPAVARVLAQDFAPMSKGEIIVHGELGLSAAFAGAGIDVGARYVSRFSATPSGLIANNPMHFRARRLLAEGTVPFVKVELLRDNPAGTLEAAALGRLLLTAMGGDDAIVRQRDAALAILADPDKGRRRGLRRVLFEVVTSDDRMAILRDAAAHLLR